MAASSSSSVKPTSERSRSAANPVIARGAASNELQAPSPVFTAQWIDGSHAVVGAGGGGSRFGMANLLILLQVNTSNPPPPAGSSPNPSAAKATKRKATEKEPSSSAKPPPPPPSSSSVPPPHHALSLWEQVDYVELEDVPWLCTPFLPFHPSEDAAGWTDEAQDAVRLVGGEDIVGLFAVSGARSFSLICVHRHEKHGFSLRRCLTVPLPVDRHNPDKKPIALVREMLIVSHDEGEVWVYHIASLFIAASLFGSSPTLVDEAVADASIPPKVLPMARWTLGSRVNDLHANRLEMVSLTHKARHASHRSAPSSRLHVLDYLVVAALVVADKTVRLASLRLRSSKNLRGREGMKKQRMQEVSTASSSYAHGHISRPSFSTGVAPEWTEEPLWLRLVPQMVQQWKLKGEDLGLPFTKLLPTSLRLVRLFGAEDSWRCSVGEGSGAEKEPPSTTSDDSAGSLAPALERLQLRLSMMPTEVEKEAGPASDSKAALAGAKEAGQPVVSSQLFTILPQEKGVLSLVLAVYDQASNSSFVVGAEIDAVLQPQNLSRSTSMASSVQSPISQLFPAASTFQKLHREVSGSSMSPSPNELSAGFTPSVLRVETRERESKYGALQLSFRLSTRQAMKVMADDAISFMAPFHATEPSMWGKEKELITAAGGSVGGPKASSSPTAAAEVAERKFGWTPPPPGAAGTASEAHRKAIERRQFLYGSVVPASWIIGTVEGKIASLSYATHLESSLPSSATAAASSSAVCAVVNERPSRSSRVCREFYPLLHENPITCVAVSSKNDVISTDVAQKIMITTLPPPKPAPRSQIIIQRGSRKAARQKKIKDYALFPEQEEYLRLWCAYVLALIQRHVWFLLVFVTALVAVWRWVFF